MSDRETAVRVKTGLECVLGEDRRVLASSRFGLLMNQASLGPDHRYSHRLLAECFPGGLERLFSPQHGLFGEQQDNMIESPHGRDPGSGLPLFSLYSETRRPTAEMLEGLDTLVVDLQDVGCRVYTFLWTVTLCLEACAEHGLRLVVLDRPNPLGGTLVEGPLLDPAYRSFVGRASIPMVHGLTLGEMTLYLNHSMEIGARVEVVPLRGWSRTLRHAATGLTWVPPSPNLPRLESVAVYPGQVLWEATWISEGRGTTTPFEQCGAPGVDSEAWREAARNLDPLRGLALRPVRFQPTSGKHAGRSCGGLWLHVLEEQSFRPLRSTLALMAAFRRLYPERPFFRPGPYEYEWDRPPLDLITGSAAVRHALETAGEWDSGVLDGLCRTDEEHWWRRVESSLLYR